MTTRPAGITLPSYTNQQFLTAGVQVTDLAFNYGSNNAYQYGPAAIVPINPTAAASTAPSSLSLQAQNAVSTASSVGGSINLTPGIGSNANASGNLVVKDTSGNGAGWNTSHYVMGTYHLWVDAKGRLRIKISAPTSDTDGNAVGLDLIGSNNAYTPGTLTTLQSISTTITVANAALGDFAIASFNLDTQGTVVTARVSSANTVTIIFYNPTNASIALTTAGVLQVKVIKQ